VLMWIAARRSKHAPEDPAQIAEAA
jgi:hypothetical protein